MNTIQTNNAREVLRYQMSNQKDRQYNGQKKNDKRTNNDLQNITQKTKNRITPAVNSCAPPGGLAVPALHVAPVVLLFNYFNCEYDKRNISVLICDRYSVTVNQVIVATVKLSKY